MPPPLTQIRKSYSAPCNDLSLSIESESAGWTVRIQRLSDRKILYHGQRGTIAAAKAAGIEFAMFHAGGATLQAGPDKLASALVWKELWLPTFC